MTVNFTRLEIEDICNKVNLNRLVGIKNLVLFVGHAHSGHSLVGSILDCHSSVSLANEINIVKSIRDFKLSKNEIFSILFSQSQSARFGGSKWLNSEYQYDNDYGKQGGSEFPSVLGDKKAGGTTRILIGNPWIVDYLYEILDVQVKFIFVKRNPVDIVAAYSYYMKEEISQKHVDRYIENYECVQSIKRDVPDSNFIEVNQQHFVINATTETQKVFNFLNVSEKKSIIDKWTSIVKKDIKGKSQSIFVPDDFIRQLEPFK